MIGDNQDTDFNELLAVADDAGPARYSSEAQILELVNAAMRRGGEKPAQRRSRAAWFTGIGLGVGALALGAAAYYAMAPEPDAERGPENAVRREAPPPLIEEAILQEEMGEPPEAGQSLKESPPPARRTRRHVPSSADALARANTLRASGQWRAAERTYRSVVAVGGPSREVQAAAIAAASLRLEHLRDARGALRLYRQVLSADPTPALGEEARWGIARALRRLGRSSDERLALEELLRRHPDTLKRSRAEERLATLTADPTTDPTTR